MFKWKSLSKDNAEVEKHTTIDAQKEVVAQIDEGFLADKDFGLELKKVSLHSLFHFCEAVWDGGASDSSDGFGEYVELVVIGITVDVSKGEHLVYD